MGYSFSHSTSRKPGSRFCYRSLSVNEIRATHSRLHTYIQNALCILYCALVRMQCHNEQVADSTHSVTKTKTKQNDISLNKYNKNTFNHIRIIVLATLRSWKNHGIHKKIPHNSLYNESSSLNQIMITFSKIHFSSKHMFVYNNS